MYSVYFSRVSFARATQYLFIIDIATETKRTEVCRQWTSAPEFPPIMVSNLGIFQVRACEATASKKLKVVGSFEIPESQLYFEAYQLHEGEHQINQVIEGKTLCVGICHIEIRKAAEISATKRKESKVSEASSDLALEKEYEESYNTFVITVHCGSHFWLESEVFVRVSWCNSEAQTRTLKNKISPIWAYTLMLQGSVEDSLVVTIMDTRNNILERFQLEVKELRVMYPYHLRVRFREYYMGDVPEIFISAIRADSPHFSILDRPIQYYLKYFGDNCENSLTYLVLSMKKLISVPKFILLNLTKCTIFQAINNFLYEKEQGDYSWEQLLPVGCKVLYLLKSHLDRHLQGTLMRISSPQLAFEQGNTNYCYILEHHDNFQHKLRDVYYRNDIVTIRQCLSISIEEHAASPSHAYYKWRMLSYNYLLRHKLLLQSQRNAEYLRAYIANEGKQLTHLKYVLREVKIANRNLVAKEKQSIIQSKQRYNYLKMDRTYIVSMLYYKQAELCYKRKMNEQISAKLGSLVELQQDFEDIDGKLVENANILLQQQGKLRRQQQMKKAIPEQRDILRKLYEIVYEKRRDRHMNYLLRVYSQQLQNIRSQKTASLEEVYKLIQGQHSKKKQVEQAEALLCLLNQEHAQYSC